MVLLYIGIQLCLGRTLAPCHPPSYFFKRRVHIHVSFHLFIGGGVRMHFVFLMSHTFPIKMEQMDKTYDEITIFCNILDDPDPPPLSGLSARNIHWIYMY